MRTRREVVSAVVKRYRSTDRSAKGRILDELCATMGWHRKHAVRALRQHEPVTEEAVEAPRERKRRYGATIKDALTALWEASDRVCGKWLKVMIPTLLPALERNDRLKLDKADRDRVLTISAASIDRLLGADSTSNRAKSCGSWRRGRPISSLTVSHLGPISTSITSHALTWSSSPCTKSYPAVMPPSTSINSRSGANDCSRRLKSTSANPGPPSRR
jgi:hypothetical protein